MNETDKRQLIDEIEFLRKSGSSMHIQELKAAAHFKTPRQILDKKRKLYNYQYSNVFKKYNADHNSLFPELDNIWNNILNEAKNALKYSWLFRLSYDGIPIGLEQILWNSYKTQTYQYAVKYAKSHKQK